MKIMTPEQKAKELFYKMYNVDDPMGSYPMCFDTAKSCAIVCVKEILNLSVWTEQMYWTEVIIELEKFKIIKHDI